MAGHKVGANRISSTIALCAVPRQSGSNLLAFWGMQIWKSFLAKEPSVCLILD